MSTLSLSRLEKLHDKLGILFKGPFKTESFYSSLIFHLERVQFSIESNKLKYGDECPEMIIMCLLMRYEIQVELNGLIENNEEGDDEESDRRMYIN